MQLKKTGISILTQLSGLIGQLTNEQYRAPLGLLNNNTVGKHVRHILEFFIILENGAASGIINYDTRPHDVLYETDLQATLMKIKSISAFLLTLPMEKPAILEVSYSSDGKESVQMPSSLQRELAYNIEHAIHHMAIIKIAVNEAFPQISIPDSFGVAYSTIRYQNIIAQ